MQRILSVAIILVLSLILTAATAEDLQLSSMSDEALELLNRQIQIELFRRSAAGNGVSVPPGLYTAGIDLPAGRYEISIAEDVVAETIEVTDKSVKYGGSNTYWLGTLYGGPKCNITLKDGDTVQINSHTVTIRPFTSLF